MSSLAAWLRAGGCSVTGEDGPEDFYTAPVLEGIEISPLGSGVPEGAGAVVASAAHMSNATVEAAKALGVPVMSYPEALAKITGERLALGVAGTHGKTTTCAVATHIMRSLGLPGGSIYGSFLQGPDKTWRGGDDFVLVEACEYRRHFLLYDLDILCVTNIAFDHPDFFKDLPEVKAAFRDRIVAMPRGGVVIFHSSLSRAAKDWAAERPDLLFVPYGDGSGFSLSRSSFGMQAHGVEGTFTCPEADIRIACDYVAGALLATAAKLKVEGIPVTRASLEEGMGEAVKHISTFPGVAARRETVLDEGGILYIDDYAHHPDEIRACLDNLRKLHGGRRIVVLFMPHTASRTSALMKDFADALSKADAVFVQDTWAARGDGAGSSDAKELADRLDRKVFRSFYGRLSSVSWTPGDEQAAASAAAFLAPGDILLALGAGDNRKLLPRVAELRRNQ